MELQGQILTSLISRNVRTTQVYCETLYSTRSTVCRTVSSVRVAGQGRTDRVCARHQRPHSQQIRRVVWLAIPAAETRYATSKYCDINYTVKPSLN